MQQLKRIIIRLFSIKSLNRKFIIGIILSFIFSLSSFSQDETIYKNEVNVGFFQFFVNTFQVGYERQFVNSSSLALSGGFTLRDDAYEKAIGTSAELQYRVYVWLEERKFMFLDLDGVYFGPYGLYRYYDITEYEDPFLTDSERIDYEFPVVGGGIVVGFKLYVVDRISVDFNIGGGLRYSFLEEDRDTYYSYEIVDPEYTGILPRSNLTVGIRF